MNYALGYATIIGHKGTTEADTLTCNHCSAVRYQKSTDPSIVADPGGICRKCMAWICSSCLARDCMTFERKMEIYESRQDLWKKMGLEF